MTVNSSIDPARLLEEQLAQASTDPLRELLTTFVNTLMSAEADAVCGAAYGTTSPDRVNRRDATLDLPVPKLRQSTYFPEWVLKRHKRAERGLTSATPSPGPTFTTTPAPIIDEAQPNAFARITSNSSPAAESWFLLDLRCVDVDVVHLHRRAHRRV